MDAVCPSYPWQSRPHRAQVAVANGFVSVTPLGTGQLSEDAATVVANYGRLPLFQPAAAPG
jgi:hypothetical protein